MSTNSLNKTSVPSKLSEYWCHTTVQVSKSNFTWSVENFSMCRQEHGDFVPSTSFFAGPHKELECQLHLFPKGDKTVPVNEYMSIYPKLIRIKGNKPFFVQFVISIMDSNSKLGNIQTFSVNIKETQSTSQCTQSTHSTSESITSRSYAQEMELLNHPFSPSRPYFQAYNRLHFTLDQQNYSAQKSVNSSEIKLPTFPRFAKLTTLQTAGNHMLHSDQLTIRCIVSVTYEETNDSYCTTQQEDFNPGFQIVKLSEDLESIFRDQKYCDVKLVTNNLVTMPAHKNILSSRSPVFKAMFGHNLEENKNNIVNIADIDSYVLEDFLLFIYTGRSKFLDAEPLKWRDVAELLIASDKYDVSTLKQMCADRLGKNLTVDNACNILFVADVHNEGKLKENVICFIQRNITLVVRTAGWSAVSKKSPSVIADIFAANAGKNDYN